MEENGVTLPVLREIRDDTARINDARRPPHRTRGRSGEQLQAWAAVQIRQEQAPIKRTEIVECHDESLKGIHGELCRIHHRIDNVFEGPFSTTARDYEARMLRLEGRDS